MVWPVTYIDVVKRCLGLVHIRSFWVLKSCQKTQQRKTQSLSPLSFGPYCTFLTTIV